MRRIPTLAEVERRHIFNTLVFCENNRTRAAKVLGLSVRGLRLKLHEYKDEGFQLPTPRKGRPDKCGERSEQ
jgi:DNA-binding NtrC family response regulator